MASATTATGVDAVYYGVKDVPRAIAFFRDVVGVEPSAVSEEWGAEYDLPNGAGWGVGPATLFNDKVSGATVFFAVPDVQAAIDATKAKGTYTVSELHDSPVCHMAFVNDADGNTLCLHKRKAS